MSNGAVLLEVLRIVMPGAFAWLAIKVELRWMRADIDRVEGITANHSSRLRQLEIGE